MPANTTTMPVMQPPIIEFAHVGKWYGEHQVLHDINLAVRPGERIVVCGPSGSGKSTLIRCINQLETYQSGQVIVDGIVMGADPRRSLQARLEVGMVFQQFNLFPHLSVLENCTLAPVAAGKLSSRAAREQAMERLEQVRMAHKADAYPPQLSGGQQQRVAIARALCLKPRIMLFDEPTSALDPEMVGEVLDTMLQLASDGMTMLCVTHEMGFARRVASRIVFMEAGHILTSATPEIFFGDASEPRVQAFLRSMGS